MDYPMDHDTAPLSDNDTPTVEHVDKLEGTTPTVLPSQARPSVQKVDASDLDAVKKKHIQDYPELEVEEELSFTWEIDDWTGLATLTEPRVFGEPHEAYGFNWRILVFPQGNGTNHVSLYLEASPVDTSRTDWAVCAHFVLVMWNPDEPTLNHVSGSHHRFNPTEKDWGFTKFIDLQSLFPNRDEEATGASSNALIPNNKVNISAHIRVYKDETGILWHSFVNYDSKKETGFVGLTNQGATCYLNSLLQSLYFTRKFRQLVYQIPAENEQGDDVSVALQNVFYLLHSSDTPIDTRQLTSAFGWDNGDAFQQHDVQEMERKLMDKLESQMKGTEVESKLDDLFVGKMKSFIKCVNVDFESTRTEDFWDLQMSVKGMKNLEESFDFYTKSEMLEGENQYQATGYGLQDAKKGVVFESFPPVLHLQLQRYEYDFMRDCMAKINDRYEFPLEIDLAPYMTEDADMSESWVYSLHGVLVHAGDQNAGHYYALIKPESNSHWYKFDDDRVTRATMKEVLEENYGVDSTAPTPGFIPGRINRNLIKKLSNAYMLVYIRKTRAPEVLDGDQDYIPDIIPRRIAQAEQEELRRQQELEEQQYYNTFRIASVDQFTRFEGFDLGQFDARKQRDGEIWNAQAEPIQIKAHKDTSMSKVCKLVAEKFNRKENTFRLWTLAQRQNKTYRLDKPLLASASTFGQFLRPRGRQGSSFSLWLEDIEFDDEGIGMMSDGDEGNRDGKSLLFLKAFDTQNQCMRGVGTRTVNNSDTVASLAQYLADRFNNGKEVQLFEEVKPEMVDELALSQTFFESEIDDGDIICFAPKLSEEEKETMDIKSVPECYEYVLNRTNVVFRQVPGDGVTNPVEFNMVMSKSYDYDQMSARVGKKLNVDPSHIMFFSVNHNGEPRSQIKPSPTAQLRHFLTQPYMQGPSTNVICFKVLGMTLEEWEQKQTVVLELLTEGLNQAHKYEFVLSKNATVDDLKQELVNKAEIKPDVADQLKIWSASPRGEFEGMAAGQELVEDFGSGCHLYCAVTPAEEAKVLKGDSANKLVVVQHFQSEPTHTHGVPFTFVVKKDEPFTETKHRLQKLMGVFDKVFENMKFAILSKDHPSKTPVYIDENTDIKALLGEEAGDDDSTEGESDKESETKKPFVLYDVFDADKYVLGLDHYDKSVRRMFGQAALKMR